MTAAPHDHHRRRRFIADASSRAALALAGLAFAAAALPLGGCKAKETATIPTQTASMPDYSRQLPPGVSALRRLDPSQWPDLGAAYDGRDALLLDAADHSLAWFDKPSSKTHFPLDSITHDQAKASVAAMIDLLDRSTDRMQFLSEMQRMFDVYESVGYDMQGTVFFTGYYSPILNASRERTAQFNVPLYTRPADLVTDPATGEPKGRKTETGETTPYYTRREIEQNNMFAGSELVWLESDMDAYIIHVNGSAKLRLPDTSTMYIGYAGKTDRPYASLGQAMLKAGLLQQGKANLKAMRDAYRRNPAAVRELMFVNESYVFFQEYPEGNWPAGSLGFPVTGERSLATDKKIYPRGGMVLVDTQAINFSGTKRRFLQFMLDQDTGGAIRAPGRGDLFMGIGPSAEILAGSQAAEGRLYYLFLKPEYVGEFLGAGAATVASSAR